MVRKCWEAWKRKPVELPKVDIVIDKINSSNESDAGSHADPIKKKIKYGTTYEATEGLFLEYFKESSIHGFKYIGDHKSPRTDRLIWLCALVLSICMCCYMILNIWDKRNSSPVIVSFNEKQTRVWEIPFPSVTICPEIKTRTDIFNFTEINSKINRREGVTTKEYIYWDTISQICKPGSSPQHLGSYLVNASDLIKIMLDTAPALRETIHRCIFKNSYCQFDRVLTEEGICFTFNYVNANRNKLRDILEREIDQTLEWDLDSGYRLEAHSNTFPRRVLGTGEDQSLQFYLKSDDKNKDLKCRDSIQGFKFSIHAPGEEPRVSKNYLSIPLDKIASISVKPEIIFTSENLRQYEPKRRECYFQDERYLRYFKLYTQENCELECLSNLTMKECGCVMFSMPRSSSQPVCGKVKLMCVFSVENHSFEMKFEQRRKFNYVNDTELATCNCLPTCVSINYKVELEHQIELDFKKLDGLGKPGIHETRITIGFKEEAFTALKRSELYSKTDFIANCGGLLGLFMGVSILSFVELVYFITIRLCENLQNRRKKHRKSKENAQQK